MVKKLTYIIGAAFFLFGGALGCQNTREQRSGPNDFVHRIVITDYIVGEEGAPVDQREYEVLFKISDKTGPIKNSIKKEKLGSIKLRVKDLFQWLLLNLPESRSD